MPSSVAGAWLPPVRVGPVDWVERNIYFDPRVGAYSGYWSHALFPYSIGVLECLVAKDVQEIVLCFGTQAGKTTILGGSVCCLVANDPSSTLIVLPNQKMAHEHYKVRLEPMLESCAAIRSRMPPKHLRHSERLDLGNMLIYYGYSGSPSTVSARAVRWLFISEINLWDASKSPEGDPVEMARDRTKAYPNKRIFIEGKPTIVGECRITAAYEASDQRRYHVPCPYCGQYQILKMGSRESEGGIKWKDKNPATAHYQCEICRGAIDDSPKITMLRRGQWAPAGQTVNQRGELEGKPDRGPLIAGFQLPSWYSTFITWADIATVFLKVKTLRQLQSFKNGWMAEPFEVTTRKVSYSDLADHIEQYPPGTIPTKDPAMICCAVDVQIDSLRYTIRAHDFGGSSYLIRYGFLEGFQQLERLLEDTYPNDDGRHYKVSIVLIDSRFRAGEVLAWASGRPRLVVPIRGERQYGQTQTVIPRHLKDRGIWLWRIDAGRIRDQFYDRRLSYKRGDPGYWALHGETGEDFLRAMRAWQRQQIPDRSGRMSYRWVSRDQAHEHFADCELMQEAASWKEQLSIRSAPPARRLRKRKPLLTPDGRPYLVTERV